jgi:hypothetical protein
MTGTQRAVIIVLASVWPALPTRAPAQEAGAEDSSTSQWQFGVRAVDWEAVEELQADVREYREAGAIGAYELLIRTHGARFDALVTAEIIDASKLAELRDLDRIGTTPAAAVSREPGEERPS